MDLYLSSSTEIAPSHSLVIAAGGGRDLAWPQQRVAAELLARVRALGRRGELSLDGTQTREIAPGLLLDESRHAMVHGESVVDLSAREYSLLSHLMRNRGAALTRQQLLDEVWGAEPDVYSNVVDLYVHYLRKKFEDAGYNDLIQTVRGVGYRLAEGPKA